VNETDPGLTLADARRVEDLVDRAALGEVCRSFFDLFGLPIRVFGSDGQLLASVHAQRALCTLINEGERGREACGRVVGEVQARVPGDADVVHRCFSGAAYRIIPVHYDGRVLGRIVLGPYLPAELGAPPDALLPLLPAGAELGAALADMPRVRAETAERIARHISRVLDLLLFSGHRAFLTGQLHLRSVRANYRELSEKTERLQQAYDKLKELDRLKSNFLATMSHELRTPLTSIIGYSEMLLSGIGGELVGEHREFVQVIRRKGENLLELIANLLDMSKFEQNRLDLADEPVLVGALIDDVLGTVAPLAQKRGVSVDALVDPALPAIRGDGARLRQVLQNLIDNALKFTPRGGRVSVRGARTALSPARGEAGDAGLVLMMAPSEGLRITVSDTGGGIPEAEHERIFDAFYQVDGSATREHGGTGLGLSIVKRIVEAHGGRIRVESRPGEGARFIVELPLERAP
jgi:two-component system, NarL family, sensor histidine kinase BarA